MIPYESLTGPEAQVFHRCMRQLAGARRSGVSAMKTTPPVPLKCKRKIAAYAGAVAAALREAA